MANTFSNENSLLYLLQKLKTKFAEKVDKVDGKGLSTNDLTDELKEKILNAGDSSFSGSYNDLTDKPDVLLKTDIADWAKASTKPTYTKSEVGLANVTNDKQVKGLASGTTENHVVTFGADGYTVKDSGYTIGASVPSGAKFTDTTYSDMTGATSTSAGAHGLVPAPASGKQASFLRGDGTWATPTNTTYSVATSSANGLMSSTDKSKLDAFGSASDYSKTSEIETLVTGKGYQTSAQVESAITAKGYQTAAQVQSAISAAGHVTKQIVTSLPTASAAAENVIYMIKKTDGSGDNIYDEYMLVNGALEKVGDTQTDLTGYWNETSLTAMSNTDVDTIWNTVFAS